MTMKRQSMGVGIGRNPGRANIAHRAWSLEMVITAIREETIIIGRKTWGRLHIRGHRISTKRHNLKMVELWRITTTCGD